MLEVNNIVKKYGTNTAVNNLSFTVDDGEIFGLLGEMELVKQQHFELLWDFWNQIQGVYY